MGRQQRGGTHADLLVGHALHLPLDQLLYLLVAPRVLAVRDARSARPPLPGPGGLRGWRLAVAGGGLLVSRRGPIAESWRGRRLVADVLWVGNSVVFGLVGLGIVVAVCDGVVGAGFGLNGHLWEAPHLSADEVGLEVDGGEGLYANIKPLLVETVSLCLLVTMVAL